jgi:hypothetical protein
LSATPRGFAGYRKSHPAARSVPDITDRIEILIGRPGSDEDPLPSERPLRSEYGFGRCHDLVRFGKTSFANPPAREIALTGLDKPHAVGGQCIEIGSNDLVREHLRIHRRSNQHGRPRRQVERRQEIVGDAICKFAEDVRCCGGDQQQIDGRGQGDVLDVGVRTGYELIGDYGPSCNGLERHGPNKARRILGHHGDDLVAALLQPSRHFDGLVGADAAGHAKRNQHRQPTMSLARFWLLDLLDGLRNDFLLGDGRLLVLAGRHPRGRSRQQLPGASARRYNELERIGQFAPINHL